MRRWFLCKQSLEIRHNCVTESLWLLWNKLLNGNIFTHSKLRLLHIIRTKFSIYFTFKGFIDGKGPSTIPDFVARFGVNVLKSTPLRMFANYIAYKDKVQNLYMISSVEFEISQGLPPHNKLFSCFMCMKFYYCVLCCKSSQT